MTATDLERSSSTTFLKKPVATASSYKPIAASMPGMNPHATF
jgi:hypothetical protein